MDQRLRNAADSGSIVLVVGTGVSASVSGGATIATWRGLLESGLETLKGQSDDAVLAHLRSSIDYGFSQKDLVVLLQAAERLKLEFENVGEQAFAKWLQEGIGQLSSANRKLAETLTSLPFPIVTTNYDTLLESADRATANWTDSVAIQAVLAGKSRAVGHLHGAWVDPASVIFTAPDYARLLDSESAQAVQRAASALKSLVYVGFGAGLSDPNFSRLIEWHRDKFMPSSVTHFRLCLDSEVELLKIEHANDQIVPVSYGEEYGDLDEFLSALMPKEGTVALSPSGIARDFVSDLQAEFEAELTNDAILAEALDITGSCSLEDVVRPPVLLPVPHADYMKAQREHSTDGKISRSDPHDAAHSDEVLVIAADENSGLTTAVKWLALEAATYLGGAAPLYVSFRRVGKGPSPLRRLILAEARSRGLLPDQNSVLPPHVLTLDDFSPYLDRISDRTLEDIAASDAIVKIIGCTTGAEDLVTEKLQRLGLEPRVHYLGRLSSADIRAYARLAAPADYAKLTTQVMDALQSDNLPRTPYTVALLIAVLIRGGALTANRSQTSILDDYVAMLLGRGDPHEDARVGLDQTSREALLAGLAKELVLKKTGGLSEEDTVAAFRGILERLDWRESAIEIVRSLTARRILRNDGQHVVFARSSYLHLFAAKRAAQDPDFLEHLVANPLFFSPVLMDYAAIKRHDADLVDKLNELLAEARWEIAANPVFEALPTREGPDPKTLERLHSASRSTRPPRDPDDDVDVFDAMGDTDEPPFPLTEDEELPPGMLLMRTLELVSSTLRDSDQVEDVELKQTVLRNALLHWGRLMGVISTDPGFGEFIATIFDDMEQNLEIGPLKDDERAERIDELVRVFPAAISLGGVLHTLASRKLARALDRLIPAVITAGDEELTVATAFMIFAIRDEHWIETLTKLLAKTGNVWVIRHFLLQQLLVAYYEDEIGQSEQQALLQLCVSIIQNSYSYVGADHRSAHQNQIRSELNTRRLERKTQMKALERNLDVV